MLANKLSADPSKKVLVLEAGPSGDALEVAVPAGIARLFAHPVFDWGMSSLTQKQLVAREVGGASMSWWHLVQADAPPWHAAIAP